MFFVACHIPVASLGLLEAGKISIALVIPYTLYHHCPKRIACLCTTHRLQS